MQSWLTASLWCLATEAAMPSQEARRGCHIFDAESFAIDVGFIAFVHLHDVFFGEKAYRPPIDDGGRRWHSSRDGPEYGPGQKAC